MNEQISKLSSRSQIVIPAAIWRKLDLRSGDKLAISVTDNNELRLKKLPTALEWADLIKDIPTEKVDIDDQGHYDAKKSPSFHDWMANG